MKIHHKCPDCDYASYEFASVAMHFMRCHHRPIINGYGEVLNRRLKAKFAVLNERFKRYRKQHP